VPFKLADSDADAEYAPELALVELIKEKWTIPSPNRDEINFAVRWEENNFWYEIVVENAGEMPAQRFLGNARTRYKETKMIQLWAEDHDSEQRIWAMKEHVRDILNDDARALASKGINTILAGPFNQIQMTKQMLADAGYAPDGGNNVRRGYILCDLFYDKVKY
jgi:hypothetical protein